MAGKKLMTVVLGILALVFSPVIIAVAASVGVVFALLFCSRMSATTANCEFCFSDFCPGVVIFITIAVFPLILIAIGILWYRKAAR